jgi:PRC-barrel domain
MRTGLGCAAVAVTLAITPAAGQATSGNAPAVTPGSALEPGHFVRSSTPHQWRASKLIGLDVYGTENEKIGDVVEVLIDRDGHEIVVLGIGGFLGIARRDIALPFKAVDWRYGDPPKPRESDASRPATSATTAEPTARKTVDNTRQGFPDYAFVAATKDSLKAAPEFRYETDQKSNTPLPR